MNSISEDGRSIPLARRDLSNQGYLFQSLHIFLLGHWGLSFNKFPNQSLNTGFTDLLDVLLRYLNMSQHWVMSVIFQN